MKIKINWDKPVSKICGEPPFSGARYFQDGKYFNGRGVQVVSPDDTEDRVSETNRQNQEKINEINSFLEYYEKEEDSLKDQAADLVRKGYSHTDIGKELGVTRQKVTKILCS